MRKTIRDIKNYKSRGERFAMVTAYDYTSAKLVEAAELPIILVGDSLGQTMLGYDSTVPVTMDEMVHHIKSVVKGTKNAHIVGDLPFMSYHADIGEAMRNAGRLMKEGGCQSVKLEGGAFMAETVSRIVQAGVPVMGHIGLTPQAVNQLGGYRVQGKTSKAAVKLMEDARALEEAGAYAIVLEVVPAELAGLITERLSIPTIGIGAGPQCDGQVQVFQDLLGLDLDFSPKHARAYANGGEMFRNAFSQYAADVRQGEFPGQSESISINKDVLNEITSSYGQPV